MSHVCRRCVTALVPAIATLLLAGCEPPDNTLPSSDNSPVSQPIPLASAPPVEISSLSQEISSPITPPSNAPLPAEGNTLTSGEVLDRLRARLSTPTCIVGPNNTRWRHKYAGYPQHFADEVQNTLPMMLVVLDQLEQNKLPGEFALIPIVESWYQPETHSFGGAAGMWQMLSETSRNNGATVVNGYDGRLSALDSTEAALTYLSKLNGMFNDWRLTAMAYNSGEYRLMHTMSPEELAERGAGGVHYRRPQGLSFTTYEYVSKMRALTCLLAQPERQGIPLLTNVPITHWIPYSLPADVNSLDELARRLGTDAEELKAFNRGYRNGLVVADAPRMVLVPASTRPRWASAGAQASGVQSTTATSTVTLPPMPPSPAVKPFPAIAPSTAAALPATLAPTRNPVSAAPHPNVLTSTASQAQAVANVAQSEPSPVATAKPVVSPAPPTLAHTSSVSATGTFAPPATTTSVSLVPQSTAPTSNAAVATPPVEAKPLTPATQDAASAAGLAPQTKAASPPDLPATTSKQVVAEAPGAVNVPAPSPVGSSSPTTSAPSTGAKPTLPAPVTIVPSPKPAVAETPGVVKTPASSARDTSSAVNTAAPAGAGPSSPTPVAPATSPNTAAIEESGETKTATPASPGATASANNAPTNATSNAPLHIAVPAPATTGTPTTAQQIGSRASGSATPASEPVSRPSTLPAPVASPAKPGSAPTTATSPEQTSATLSRTPTTATFPSPPVSTPRSPVVAGPASASTPAPSNGDQTVAQIAPRTHKVVLGDSLELIAQRFNVKAEDLQAWNHLAPGSKLFVDQVLKLEP